jgi:hypothetical protein
VWLRSYTFSGVPLKPLPSELGYWGRPQPQDEWPLGIADLLDGGRLHEAESADEVEAWECSRVGRGTPDEGLS